MQLTEKGATTVCYIHQNGKKTIGLDNVFKKKEMVIVYPLIKQSTVNRRLFLSNYFQN